MSTKGQAIRVALQKIVLFWAIAIACIFIPVFHFVLVPLFVILGIVFFIKGLRVEHWVEHVTSVCPHCSKDIQLSHVGVGDEYRFKCPECDTSLVLAESDPNV